MTKQSTKESIKGMILYPCGCGRKALVYESARGRVSVPCPRCGKYALFDYDHMTASICGAAKGAIHKLQQGALSPPSQ